MVENEKNKAERAKEYDASQIQVLEGLEAVRKRQDVHWFHQWRRSASFSLGNRG